MDRRLRRFPGRARATWPRSLAPMRSLSPNPTGSRGRLGNGFECYSNETNRVGQVSDLPAGLSPLLSKTRNLWSTQVWQPVVIALPATKGDATRLWVEQA